MKYLKSAIREIPFLPKMLLTAWLLTCDSNPVNKPDPAPPQLSNLSFSGNKTLVAYDSPNRITKSDTITLDFTYSGVSISTITAYAVLAADSFSWQPDTLFTTGNGTARVQWAPKNDPESFSFCGRRVGRCILSTPETTVTSDTFTLIGNKAVELVGSIPQDTLFSDDTFFIDYLVNSDKISNIQAFLDTGLQNDSLEDWIEIDGAALRVEDVPPIRFLRKAFIPARFFNLFDTGSTYAIKFLLRDYGVSDPTASLVTSTLIFTNRNSE